MKDGLIRDVTHELKTPVAKHAMEMEMLKEVLARHRLQEETGKIVRVMEASIRRQEEVIRNILNLARLRGAAALAAGGGASRLAAGGRPEGFHQYHGGSGRAGGDEAGAGHGDRRPGAPVARVLQSRQQRHPSSGPGTVSQPSPSVSPSATATSSSASRTTHRARSPGEGKGLRPLLPGLGLLRGERVGLTIARKIVGGLGGTIRMDPRGGTGASR